MSKEKYLKKSGQRIRNKRKEKGLTQEDLARRLGISRQSVCNYENGTFAPTDEHKMKLAEVLECKVWDLFYLDT